MKFDEHYFLERNLFHADGSTEHVKDVRCTNLTLKMFGIYSTEPRYGRLDVFTDLKDAGFVMVSMNAWESARKFGSDRTPIPLYYDKTGWKNGNISEFNLPDFDKFKEGITVRKFAKLFPTGDYIIGTKDHSMALRDGTLADYSERGFDGRRIETADQVFTQEAFEGLKK